jgi:hypothetical protein
MAWAKAPLAKRVGEASRSRAMKFLATSRHEVPGDMTHKNSDLMSIYAFAYPLQASFLIDISFINATTAKLTNVVPANWFHVSKFYFSGFFVRGCQSDFPVTTIIFAQ